MKNQNKRIFINSDVFEPIKSLSLGQKGELLDAIFKYHLGEEVKFSDKITEMAFSFMCVDFDREKSRIHERKLDISQAEWASLRSSIFERDEYTCQYCGKKGGRLECDHVHPFSLGGHSVPENLVTACVSCNRSKGAKTLSEWRQ